MNPNTAAEKYIVLISAERPGMALETLGEACRQMRAALDAKAFVYQQVLTKYHGEIRTSFAVIVPRLRDARWLAVLAHYYGQESILFLLPADAHTQQRPARLVSTDTPEPTLLRAEKIGAYEAVSEVEARASEGFVYNPATATCYTVTQRPMGRM